MKRFGQAILALFILGVAANAMFHYGFRPLGENLLPEMQRNFQAHAAGIYTHVFAAVFALALGPLQFSQRLRRTLPQLHRWLGRLYLGVGVLVGGLAGLYMAVLAWGGPVAKLGFASLALAWLYTGWRAYRAIRAGRVAQHRAWMVRNFSLTLAAVSLRIYLPLSMVAGIDFGTAYPVIAWMCWIPNLLLAEAVWNRGRGGAAPVSASLQGPAG